MPTELTYKPQDKIEFLFIKFFEAHHKEMMARTHGHWDYRVIPLEWAKSMVANGAWDTQKDSLAVSMIL